VAEEEVAVVTDAHAGKREQERANERSGSLSPLPKLALKGPVGGIGAQLLEPRGEQA
jgi:hypothetical protein